MTRQHGRAQLIAIDDGYRCTLESGRNSCTSDIYICCSLGIEQNLNAQQLSEVLCDDMAGKVCQFLNE